VSRGRLRRRLGVRGNPPADRGSSRAVRAIRPVPEGRRQEGPQDASGHLVHGLDRLPGGSAARDDKTDTITYEGDRYVQRDNGRVWQAGTFAIVDATASPKRIEYVCTEGQHKGLRFRSIYALDGDEHQICSDDANGNRPKKFSGNAGFLRVTKRQKD